MGAGSHGWTTKSSVWGGEINSKLHKQMEHRLLMNFLRVKKTKIKPKKKSAQKQRWAWNFR